MLCVIFAFFIFVDVSVQAAFARSRSRLNMDGDAANSSSAPQSPSAPDRSKSVPVTISGAGAGAGAGKDAAPSGSPIHALSHFVRSQPPVPLALPLHDARRDGKPTATRERSSLGVASLGRRGDASAHSLLSTGSGVLTSSLASTSHARSVASLFSDSDLDVDDDVVSCASRTDGGGGTDDDGSVSAGSSVVERRHRHRSGPTKVSRARALARARTALRRAGQSSDDDDAGRSVGRGAGTSGASTGRGGVDDDDDDDDDDDSGGDDAAATAAAMARRVQSSTVTMAPRGHGDGMMVRKFSLSRILHGATGKSPVAVAVPSGGVVTTAASASASAAVSVRSNKHRARASSGVSGGVSGGGGGSSAAVSSTDSGNDDSSRPVTPTKAGSSMLAPSPMLAAARRPGNSGAYTVAMISAAGIAVGGGAAVGGGIGSVGAGGAGTAAGGSSGSAATAAAASGVGNRPRRPQNMTLDAFIQREAGDNTPSPVLSAPKRRVKRSFAGGPSSTPPRPSSIPTPLRTPASSGGEEGRVGPRSRLHSDSSSSMISDIDIIGMFESDVRVVDDVDNLDLGASAHGGSGAWVNLPCVACSHRSHVCACVLTPLVAVVCRCYAVSGHGSSRTLNSTVTGAASTGAGVFAGVSASATTLPDRIAASLASPGNGSGSTGAPATTTAAAAASRPAAPLSEWFFTSASASVWKNLDEVLWSSDGKHGKDTHVLRCVELRGHKAGTAVTCMDVVGDR